MKAPTDASAAAVAWDDAAQGWDGHSALIRDWLREATAAMLDAAAIAPGARVLDVAAGAGDQTLDVAQRVGTQGQVLVTDISPGILERAAHKLDAAGWRNVRTLQADAQALGLAGANCDAAVCRLGLMFCASPLRALQSIHLALAPGARLSGLVFAGPEANPCIAITMQTALRHAGATARNPFEPGSLLSLGRPGLLPALLHEAGFERIEVRPLSAPFVTPRCADYVAFVRSAGSPVRELLKSLDAPARERAWAEIEQRLDIFSTPGGWSGPNQLLLFAASKPSG
ncbi:MAG: class I SAM-dependent methyltransferase [Burkholderiaceae bacterium]